LKTAPAEGWAKQPFIFTYSNPAQKNIPGVAGSAFLTAGGNDTVSIFSLWRDLCRGPCRTHEINASARKTVIDGFRPVLDAQSGI
jgi:hypothetical protein